MSGNGPISQLTLVDTDILIDFARGDKLAANKLQALQQSSRLTVSVITEMELVVGCANKAELKALESFLQQFQVIKLSEVMSDTATALLKQYKLSHNLLIPDALIAATAIALGEPLISKN